jgi:hypothetical protein
VAVARQWGDNPTVRRAEKSGAGWGRPHRRRIPGSKVLYRKSEAIDSLQQKRAIVSYVGLKY